MALKKQPVIARQTTPLRLISIKNPRQDSAATQQNTPSIAKLPARAPKIAIVIPAYNEAKNLEKVLDELQKLRKARPRWRILPIIINDGSTDHSKELLERVGPLYEAYSVHLPLNLGIGSAVQTGFQCAVRWGADVTLQLDGDGQHPALEIPNLVCPILAKRADVVVGSRYIKGAGGNVSSSMRQWGTYFFSRLLKVLVGINVRDTTSGFRAFSADATDFLARYYPDDYPEVEAYVPLARHDFTISEVPVKMRPRSHGASSITPIRSLYYMIKVAIATMMDTIRPIPIRRHSGRLQEEVDREP